MSKRVKLAVTRRKDDRRLDELDARPAPTKTTTETTEEILLRLKRIEERLGIK